MEDYKPFLEAPTGWHKHLKWVYEFFLRSNSQMNVLQIKEKFGHLRWYADNMTDKEETIVNYIQWLCGHTCTNCGSMDQVKTETVNNWIYTMCPICISMVEKPNQNEQINRNL